MPSATQVEIHASTEMTNANSKILAAQKSWRERPLSDRLQILKRCRHLVARDAKRLADAIELPQRRSIAESVAAEVFPLADAIRFLERNANRLLKPRTESKQDRPAWGRGLRVVTHRDPLGLVLVIGTWNYPLFLTGVQTIQALVVGNAVLIKPGDGCSGVTKAFVRLLEEAGLPANLVSVLPEEAESAKQAIQNGVDKVVFTGSAKTGRAVMRQLAETGTPSVMELSGCDSVFVLPSADIARAAKCIAFGLQINGSSTCIAPRRVFVTRSMLADFKAKLLSHIPKGIAAPVAEGAGRFAAELVLDAIASEAKLLAPAEWNDWSSAAFPVTVLEFENATHSLLHSDVFAPVVSLIPVRDMEEALRYDAECPYALGASVFGAEPSVSQFARRVDAGCVVVNDMIAPTADPRVAFGGRRESGFGMTRGAEGLLEMTQVKSVVTQTSGWLPHLDRPIPELAPMLLDFLKFNHGANWKEKWQAMQSLAKSGREYWSAAKQADKT